MNGGWGDWLSWSACGSNCRRTRSRKCDEPVPTNGGNDCVGDGKDIDKCCPDTMIITSSKTVNLSDWSSDVINVLAIGGGGGRVRFNSKYFSIVNFDLLLNSIMVVEAVDICMLVQSKLLEIED